MNRIMTLLPRCIPLLVLAALSVAWFGEGAEATGAQEAIARLEGFSARGIFGPAARILCLCQGDRRGRSPGRPSSRMGDS